MIQCDTAGQPIIFYDMCAHCNMTTGGQHESHCPLFKQQMEQGYQAMGEINIKIAEVFLPIALETYPKYGMEGKGK